MHVLQDRCDRSLEKFFDFRSWVELRPCLVSKKIAKIFRFFVTLNLAAHEVLNIDKKVTNYIVCL
jgi:hypothetical protein